MLTDILSSLPIRSGRSAQSNEELSSLRGNRGSGIDAPDADDAVGRFREMMAKFSGRTSEAAPRSPRFRSQAFRQADTQDTAVRTSPSSTATTSNTTTSARATTSSVSSAATFSSPIAMPPSTPAATNAENKTGTAYTANPLHPVYNVPMVSQAAREAYIHFSQTTGHVWNTSAPAEEQGGFATTTYRVPSWGLQDFVTSDGMRHRFDVGLIYPTKGYEEWNGMDVNKIHPEVESFVLNRFKADLAAEGIPESAFSAIKLIRVHGGTTKQQWFVDVLRVEKPNGEAIFPQMNVAMRDPKHVMEIMREFAGLTAPMEIPT